MGRFSCEVMSFGSCWCLRRYHYFIGFEGIRDGGFLCECVLSFDGF